MGWVVAANMAKLRDQIKARWPGVIIGSIGDLEHSQGVSGHNPDDMAGVRAELSDGDKLQEVRALDPMVGLHFTKADATELVRVLTTVPACQARLYYVIWNGRIAGRSSGWQWERYDGDDPHTNHAHLSGWAADDANTAAWPLNASTKEARDMTPAEMVTALKDPTVAAMMRAFPWQYPVRTNASALNVLFTEFRLTQEAILASVRSPADRDAIIAAVTAKAAELGTAVGQVDEAVLAGLTGPLVVAIGAALAAEFGDLDTAAVEHAVETGVRNVLGSLDEPA